ncbi:MAG TPA: response regulator [Burkholderiales bacterium]|nr:response regulator [Burkholderiales bacterium]
MAERLPADEIYALTERGKEELQNAATSCSVRELELLVLLDGVTGVRRLAAAAKSTPADQVPALLEQLVKAGLAHRAAGSDAGPGYSYFGGTGMLQQAAKEAEAGTADLKKKGYYVSIARRAARPRVPATGAAPHVLIVEDDAVLAKMLGHLMTLEGFAPRNAARRAQIDAELAASPAPALVLLDVVLPDADGFEILEGMKRDPARRDIPVIVVTARTTREDVMRGLAGGADGYITKPIAYEALASGVKSVLGLGAPAGGEAGPGDVPRGPDDTLGELRKEYRKGLALKLGRMESLARTLAAGLPRRAEFEELQRMAHGMTGAAPTFGLPEVGAAARSLEQALIELGASPQGDAGKARERLAALLKLARALR